MSVPEEAVAAAAEAMNEELGYEYPPGDRRLAELIEVALEAAAPFIRAGERERVRGEISPAQLRKLADWFDADDVFKTTMFPDTWPQRGHEVQDDLRRWADLLEGS